MQATWSLVRHAAPYLKMRHGSVVTVSSDAGIAGESGIGAYSVAKAALVMMTRMLALDCAPDVRVNTVAPGFTLPGMRHMPYRSGPEPGPEPVPPLGTYAQPEDIAPSVVFLLDGRAGHITGSTLLVDGGQKAGTRP